MYTVVCVCVFVCVCVCVCVTVVVFHASACVQLLLQHVSVHDSIPLGTNKCVALTQARARYKGGKGHRHETEEKLLSVALSFYEKM